MEQRWGVVVSLVYDIVGNRSVTLVAVSNALCCCFLFGTVLSISLLERAVRSVVAWMTDSDSKADSGERRRCNFSPRST